ncbi:MAG: YraN family protein [Acutalibacteraceae bacterium]|nr:YraN family protein [Acutalibacteraceae bacterium]
MNIGSKGAKGEKLAEKYLKKHKYKIIFRNYQTRFGEIDIIAKKDNIIAFCEVKTRTPGALVSGKEAVDKYKQKRIIKTALDYISRFKPDLQPRFDVIEVVSDSKNSEVEHIENAFEVRGIDYF